MEREGVDNSTAPLVLMLGLVVFCRPSRKGRAGTAAEIQYLKNKEGFF